MKKALIFGLMLLALMAFVAVTVTAGEGCPSKAKAKSSNSATVDKAKATTVGSKSGCSQPCPSTKGAATSASATNANHPADCNHPIGVQCNKDCGYAGQCQMATISIKGMTCAGCEGAVSAALTDVPGVVKVQKVSYQDEVAYVCYDPTKVKSSVLTQTVASKGYQAQIVPAVATSTTVDEATAKTVTKKLPCGAAADAPCAATCNKAKKTSSEKTAEGTR